MAVDFEGCARPTPARVPMPGLWSLRTLRRGALRLWPPRDGILRVQYCTRLAQGCGPVPAYKIKNARPNLALISSLSPVRGRQTDPLRSGERLQRRLSPGKASLPYFASETGKPSPLRRPRPGLLTWARGGGVRLLMPGVQYCTRLAGPESQPQYARPDLVPVSSLPPVHGGMADLMPSGERCRR